MIFLDYQVARENQAQYVETDPFKTLVKDGELRQQGKEQWRLSEFLDYRGAHSGPLRALARESRDPHVSTPHVSTATCARVPPIYRVACPFTVQAPRSLCCRPRLSRGPSSSRWIRERRRC